MLGDEDVGTCSMSMFLQVVMCYLIFGALVGFLMVVRRRLQWEVENEEEAAALRTIETIKNRRKFIASLSAASGTGQTGQSAQKQEAGGVGS